MRVINYAPDYYLSAPLRSGAVDLVRGALLKRGTTAGTNTGFLIQATGAGAHPDCVGILRQAFAGSSATVDSDTAGTVFTTRPIDLIVPTRIVRIRYSLLAADDIDATTAVNTTTITLADLENDIDTAFLYVVRGTGAGQTNYLTASAAGSATLKAAFTTSLDTTSRLIKILPRFHQTARLTADGTALASAAEAGSMDVMVLESFIIRDTNEEQLNPTSHDALVGLDAIGSIQFEADIVIQDSFAYPID